MLKKLLLVLALTVSTALPANITFAWDQNTEPDIGLYRLFRSVNGGAFLPTVVPYPTHQFTFTDMTVGNAYQLYVTAVNTNALESGPSTMLSFTLPAVPPPINVQKATVSGAANGSWLGVQVFFDTINLASFQASNYVVTATQIGGPPQTLSVTNSPATFPVLPILDTTFSVSVSNSSGTSPTGVTAFKSSVKPANPANIKVQTGP